MRAARREAALEGRVVTFAQRRILSAIVIVLVVATAVFVAQPSWLGDIWPFAATAR